MNYTEEQTRTMIEAYTSQPCRGTVEVLAKDLGKSIKSVIGKLSKEGVYRRETYRTKRGELPITKLEIVESISNQLELELLVGLEKAPKQVLQRIERAIAEKLE